MKLSRSSRALSAAFGVLMAYSIAVTLYSFAPKSVAVPLAFGVFIVFISWFLWEVR